MLRDFRQGRILRLEKVQDKQDLRSTRRLGRLRSRKNVWIIKLSWRYMASFVNLSEPGVDRFSRVPSASNCPDWALHRQSSGRSCPQNRRTPISQINLHLNRHHLPASQSYHIYILIVMLGFTSLHTHGDGFSGLDHDSIDVWIGLSALHRGSSRTLSKYMYVCYTTSLEYETRCA